MGAISVDYEKCNMCGVCVDACPFMAIDIKADKVDIGAACKMCRLCIKKCPKGALALIEEKKQRINKVEWKGVLVFVEHMEGEIHPVTYELIGKARELAGIVNHPVYCLFMGNGIRDKAQELLYYGVDRVFTYDYKELQNFRVDAYTNVFEDCIRRVKPCVVLVGATSIGRSLAPRVSTRCRTGLTADCTALKIRPNTDLVQIRPAFGGNIMAQIITPNTRPQFATVRYKVMDKAQRVERPWGEIEICQVDESRLKSGIKVLKVVHKEKEPSITESDVLVVAGRGVKDKKDLHMLEELAYLLDGQLAATRPLIEAGWLPYTKQIGLSGRTVKPKLIITCGVSGAVQFTASMNASENIFAINTDRNAPIFKIAHYGIIGDLYQVVPGLIKRIKGGKANAIQ